MTRAQDGSPVEPKPTAYALLERLLQGPRTAGALAGEVGVDVAAARRHLEEHLAAGRVEAAFRQEGIGRPRKYYEITLRGRESLPRRYDLLAQLLVEAIAAEDPEVAGRVVERLAQRVANDLKAGMPGTADAKTRARALVQSLRALGFPTELETRDGRLVIRRTDCIFLQAANASPQLVCRQFDTRILELVLGQDVELRACLPESGACCLHEVRTSRNN